MHHSEKHRSGPHPAKRPRSRICPERQYSPVFYDLYHTRLIQMDRGQFGCLSILLIIALLACVPTLVGVGSVFSASFAAAMLIWAVVGTILGNLDSRQARVLPYFERRLGGIDTWLAGEYLLANSRALDQIAFELGVTPLSEFASGDPLIAGETTAMFDAAPALLTVDALLGAEITRMLGEPVVSDLTRLRAALALAQEQGVRFSLHLRQGNTASGYEMDMRRGSYF